jgi:uncharacterized protein (DUF1501 family)
MSKQNRRQLLMATAAAGLASAIPATANESREMVDSLRQAVGRQLELTNVACGARNAVRISSVEDRPGHGLKQFVLHMEGPSDEQMPEGIYRARSLSGGVDTAMHIMPAGDNQYAAYFALVGE